MSRPDAETSTGADCGADGDRLLQVVAGELRMLATRIEVVAATIVCDEAAARRHVDALLSVDTIAQTVTECARLIDAVVRHGDVVQALDHVRLAAVRDRLRRQMDGVQMDGAQIDGASPS